LDIEIKWQKHQEVQLSIVLEDEKGKALKIWGCDF